MLSDQMNAGRPLPSSTTLIVSRHVACFVTNLAERALKSSTSRSATDDRPGEMFQRVSIECSPKARLASLSRWIRHDEYAIHDACIRWLKNVKRMLRAAVVDGRC